MFEFLADHPRLGEMTRTIHVAANDIAHFVVVFICVLMTYACVGHFMYVSFARRGAKSSARRFCLWLFASLARCHDDDRHNRRDDGGGTRERLRASRAAAAQVCVFVPVRLWDAHGLGDRDDPHDHGRGAFVRSID